MLSPIRANEFVRCSNRLALQSFSMISPHGERMSRMETRADTSQRNSPEAALHSAGPQHANAHHRRPTRARSGATSRLQLASRPSRWGWLAPVLAGSAAALGAAVGDEPRPVGGELVR